MAPLIGICIGDVTGIGPEVTLRALAGEDLTRQARFLLLGDLRLLQRLNQRWGLRLPLVPPADSAQAGRIEVHPCGVAPVPEQLPPGAPLAAQAALAWLRAGGQRALQGELDALVTAPVNKAAIIRSGERFVGQTELFAELAGAEGVVMMLLGDDDRGRWLRVALATTHLPLKDVASRLDQAKVQLAIERAAQACRDLALPRARVGVCGLNPHAGEGGEFGDEELRIIGPAVEACRQRGVEAVGPLAADALFYQAFHGEFDAVVAMYHDQGLAPLKMVAFERGVNWTLGLPFIRTAPDHGTAYDIAGRGVADPSSMRAAIRLAVALARRRQAASTAVVATGGARGC